MIFIKMVVIGIICGVAAWIFVDLIALVRDLFGRLRNRFGIWPPAMPLLGGVLLSVLSLVIPTDYLALSMPLRETSLRGEDMAYVGFWWKAFLVDVTWGEG